METKILDSGVRREFDSGAVRDIQEGKGRCDLLPLHVVASLMDDRLHSEVISQISDYMETGHDYHLFRAIKLFCEYRGWSTFEAILEVSKHYEEGALKYGERNWEKGIPLHCYIDSGVRHFLKYAAGWTDEPHDRAFVWNMLGAIWTLYYRSDLDDIPHNVLKRKCSEKSTSAVCEGVDKYHYDAMNRQEERHHKTMSCLEFLNSFEGGCDTIPNK